MNPYQNQTVNLVRTLQLALVSCSVSLLCLSPKAICEEPGLIIDCPIGLLAPTAACETQTAKTPASESHSSESQPSKTRTSKAHTAKLHASKTHITKRYKGEVEIDAAASIEPKTPAEQIDVLANRAYSKSTGYTLPHSRNPVLKVVRDMAQYATTYKGFESSSEAADVILSEKNKLKSTSACEYAKQKEYDALHSQVTTCILQIAMGLGINEAGRKDQLVKSGTLKLNELVGEEEALKALNRLTTWSDQVKAENRIISGAVCDVLEIQNKFNQILSKAMQGDAVVNTISYRLHKYNRHSNASRVAAKVINTSLSLAALTPTIISPAAQVTQFCYIAATGGPEESKLLKEVYLDRRLEERWRRLNQEANLALNNYNLALLTGNPVLLACSESIIKGMVGTEATGLLLPNTSSQLAVSQ